MTAYFSVPLYHVVYTVKDFWISFAVVLLLSWSALFVFGVFSGTVQTVPFWDIIWKSVKDAAMWIYGKL